MSFSGLGMLAAGIGPKNFVCLIKCVFNINEFGETLAFLLTFWYFYPAPSLFPWFYMLLPDSHNDKVHTANASFSLA